MWTPLTNKALATAARLHHGQFRKDGTTPFIVHPAAVAAILAQAGAPEAVIAAGYLHDVLEDVSPTLYTKAHMLADFGPRITQIVVDVSEVKDPDATPHEQRATWRARKEAYLAHLKTASQDALMVSAADMMHNLYSEEETDPDSIKFNASDEERAWFYGSRQSLLISNLTNSRLRNLICQLETRR